ncbi:hypothetical protein SAMN06265361_101498 [Laceyella tengchongensis]|jgi:hypothetical protein|uniref:Uncharacterized protein n=2 Tax=Laceyella tengchongensis TaxID=574699 RepID=A0AA45WJR9_9BACL|nr:hypothetical protein SAMN06265361_101498 [Laceyella tengchongensis]
MMWLVSGVILMIVGLSMAVYNLIVVYTREGVDRVWKRLMFLFLETASFRGIGGWGIWLMFFGIIFAFVLG